MVGSGRASRGIIAVFYRNTGLLVGGGDGCPSVKDGERRKYLNLHLTSDSEREPVSAEAG